MNDFFQNKIISSYWPAKNPSIILPCENIYHYTNSIEVITNILQTGDLWLTKATALFDQLEINYGIKLVTTILDALPSTHIDFKTFVKQKIVHERYSQMFILSTSLNPSSIYLWDNYAKPTGYNIEISSNYVKDLSEFKEHHILQVYDYCKIDKICGLAISPRVNSAQKSHGLFGFQVYANHVMYNKNKQIELINEILHYMYINYKKDGFYFGLMYLTRLIPFLKDANFSPEEEYRIIIELSPCGNYFNDNIQSVHQAYFFRNRNNVPIPLLKLNSKDMSYFKSISIGYSHNEHETEIIAESFAIQFPKVKVKTVNTKELN